MKTFFSKIKGAFSDQTKPEPLDKSFTDAIIKDVDGAPFALSESNVLYAGMNELAGYHYFKTIIIGTFKIKTFKGAQLLVNGHDFKLELQSDMLELTSETSKVPNRNVTSIDFEIKPEELSKISRTSVKSLEIHAKGNLLKFEVIEGHFDSELSARHKTDTALQEEHPNATENQDDH